MSESTTPPVDKTGGQSSDKGAATPPANKTPKTYTQEEVDTIVSERTRILGEKHTTELADKDAAIDKFRQAQMTEEEKKIEAARKEGAKEAEIRLAEREREYAHKDAYIESGINPKRVAAAFAIVKAQNPKADPAEATAFLKKEYPEFFSQSKSFGPGDGVSRTSVDEEWTDERIDEAIRNGTYDKHREAIAKARARRANNTGVLVIPPV